MSEVEYIAEPTMFNNQVILNNTHHTELLNALLNESYYYSLRERVTMSEDEAGNYDYSQVSNLGMVYLYIHNKDKKRKDKTKKDYARILLYFLQDVAELGKSDIRELSRFDMETFQAKMELKGKKSTTLSKKVIIIRSFLFWCIDEGYIKKNIARGMRSVKKIKEEIPERDIDELDLKRAVEFYKDNPKVQSLLLLLGNSGMRLNELIQPAWGDLYYDRRRERHYLITRTKRDKIRHVHIKEYVLAVLIEYRRRVGLSTELNREDKTPFYPNRMGKRHNLSSLSNSLSKYMQAAGLTTVHGDRATPHFLRHFFVQAAYANGAPLDWISETLDHSSTKITKDNYLSRQMKKERDVSDFVNIDIL